MKKQRLPDSQRYYLATHKGRKFLVSATNYTVLEQLARCGGMFYDELASSTGIPSNTIYVFVGRLVETGLVEKTERQYLGRRRVVLSIASGVDIDHKLELVR